MYRAVLLTGLLFLVGCGRYFMPDRDATDTLSTADVVGTWRLTEGSIRDLARHHYNADRTHSIRFDDDGSCVFDSVLDQGFDVKRVSTDICTWELVHDSQWVDAKNALEMRVGNQLWALRFAREDDGIHLWEFLGDPDNWEFIEYSLDLDRAGGSGAHSCWWYKAMCWT